MWSFFLTHNRFSYLLVVGLILLGLYAVSEIPRESAPEVEIPVGIVTTTLPGASAEEVERLVTTEIENQIENIAAVQEVSSVSRESVSSITVEFEASADLDNSLNKLREEVDIAARDLPADASDPRVTEVDFVDQPIVTFAISGDVETAALQDTVDALTSELETLPGVARVETSGISDEQIQVSTTPTALSRYNVDVATLANALRQADSRFPIGELQTAGVRYPVTFAAPLTTPADFSAVQVDTLAGTPVYLRDVATVTEVNAARSTLSRLSVSGSPANPSVTFNVFKQPGGDITRTAAAVQTTLAELQTEGKLLSGLTVATLLDSGEQIADDLQQLAGSGLQTVVLVVLFLVLAIGWREGLIAGTAVPFSFLIGFIGMYLSGNTINFLSLFSLILGIGVLVDAAIVMVEGINRRMKDNPDIDKTRAAIETVREYSTPLIAGTLTTVAMFSGLFIVSGVTGQFIASIPYTILFLLLGSLFVALAIIPLFASGTLRRRSRTLLERVQITYARKLEAWYSRRLRSILGHRARERAVLWALRLGFIAALALPVTGIVPVVFFDEGDTDYVFVEIELPPGSTLANTDLAARRVEDVLYRQPAIAEFTTTVGAGSQLSGGGVGEELASMLLVLAENRDTTSLELIRTLRSEFSRMDGFEVTVGQQSAGPPAGAPISLRFIGDDLAALESVAARAAQILRRVEGTTNIATNADNRQLSFELALDRVRAATYGVTPDQITTAARSAVSGLETITITDSVGGEKDVVLALNLTDTDRVDPNTQNVFTIDRLLQTEILTAQGSVPIASLANVTLSRSQNAITRLNSERVMTVTADVTDAVNPRATERAAVSRIQNEIQMPAGVRLETGGGEAEESDQAFRELFLALVVGILLMIAILTLQFNSYRHTYYVLSILPYSLIGILSGLAVTGNSLSFPSIMGFIALSGIVVNNSILLIDSMNRNRRRNQERDLRELVIESAAKRLRPILLTTVTTVLGMIPLLFADPIWAPLAYAVMFGLAFSVLITLLLIPIIYYRNPGQPRP